MTVPAEQQQDAGLSPQEQASVEAGRTGLQDVPLAPAAPQGPQRPDYIPEKFWNAETGQVNTEALAKSYAELEKTRGQPAAPEATPAAEATPAEAPASKDGKIEPPKEGEAEAANPLTGLIEKARTEWSEGEAISDETFEAFEKAGVPREIVDLYLEGVKARTVQLLSDIHSYAGGEENYNQMAAWAASNMSEEEADAYNAALDNPALRENAVRGLYARFSASRPNEGTLVTPNGGPTVAGDVYSSREEFLADQAKPEYRTDAKFRGEVAAKLERSRASGSLDAIVARSSFARQVLSS